MKQKYSILSILLVSIAFLATSCKTEKVKKRTETLYAYEVDVAVESYSAGVLRYMESEYYEGDRLIKKTYYNNDQSVKGTEYYYYEDQDSLPESSKYYDGKDVLSATYKFENKDGFQVQRDGYDGATGELLRQERYQYDSKGNRVIKMIFDSYNNLNRSFRFGHDTYGNEREMTITDANDNVLAKEIHEIALVNDDNRWLEKWGYVNDDKYPKTFYRKSYK